MAARQSEKNGGAAGFIANIPEFIQQVRTETGKVSWPSRKQTMMTAVMVVILTAGLSIFFLLVDLAFSHATQFLLSLLG